MAELNPPSVSERDGMVFGTNRARLAQAMTAALTNPANDTYTATFEESADPLGQYKTSRGLENPYGSGLEAYEPNTVIFRDYENAYDAVQKSKAAEAATKDTTISVDFTSTGAPLGEANGQIGQAINAALELAQRRVPYVWGGTSRNGVDCSGLIYYAFRAAGIDVPRYRAVDYGTKIGQTVSAQDARPGDLVYFDNPNTSTDHIGIYLGNGKMVQAPRTGDVVRVTNVGHATSYRRVFEDSQFQQVVTPDGGAYWGYGSNAQQWGGVAPTAYTPPAPGPGVIRRTGTPDRRFLE